MKNAAYEEKSRHSLLLEIVYVRVTANNTSEEVVFLSASRGMSILRLGYLHLQWLMRSCWWFKEFAA